MLIYFPFTKITECKVVFKKGTDDLHFSIFKHLNNFVVAYCKNINSLWIWINFLCDVSEPRVNN